jgi:hypothetical protein
MKQTRNKDMSKFQRDEREYTFDSCLKKVFSITAPLSNKAFVAWFWLFIAFVVFLVIWKITGFSWARYAGIASFALSTVSIAVAFLAQTGSQGVRCAAFAKAKIRGGRPLAFREASPDFTKLIRKYFHTSKTTENVTRNVHAHTNARSYRHASRPTFAHASSSPGGDGSDDGSGDSDSGDPPERQNPVTPPDSSEQSNKQHHPWRSPGRFRVSRRSQRRRFA